MKFSQLGSPWRCLGPLVDWRAVADAYRLVVPEPARGAVWGAITGRDVVNPGILQLQLVTAMQEIGPTYD